MTITADQIARAYDRETDRLHDEYYREYADCPQCGEPTLDGSAGSDRSGQWCKVECLNDECDYAYDDVEIYDDYGDYDDYDPFDAFR